MPKDRQSALLLLVLSEPSNSALLTMYLRLTPVCFFNACAKMSSTISRGTASESRVPLCATDAPAAAARTAARAAAPAADAIATEAGRAAIPVMSWCCL
jgi:hypothetical protein